MAMAMLPRAGGSQNRNDPHTEQNPRRTLGED